MRPPVLSVIRRNPLLISVLAGSLLWGGVVAALDRLIDWQVEVSIKQNAETRATRWANSFFDSADDFRRLVEQGITTPDQVNRIEDSFALVDVIRFEIFDRNGMQTFLSDAGILEPSDVFNSTAKSAFDSGQTLVFFHEHEDDDESRQADIENYVEVYIPARLPNGERIGAMEVYVDVSTLKEALEDTFQRISWYLITGTVLVLLFPAIAYVHRTRQLMRKDRELLELTRYDQLTGTLDRNSIADMLETIFSQRNSGAGLGILFVDVDYFKQVNDQYGHQCGDKLLQHVAGILQSSTRAPTDIVGRYGGDEFVLLCPGVDLDELRKVYRRLIENARTPCTHQGNSYVPSLSVGAYVATSQDTERTALHKADLAVYQAKKNGRGQVVEYSDHLQNLFDRKPEDKSA
ncbi:diguanylate cyclase (GGDEF)-like protein [Roseibium hamelinense]|uniref:Diguanylate cyclase (GGDEF)-like protein n=1 Tax=Roseibium hamelinense TaxID=150831 RepID=A0A562TGJ8_9HYPH|nr:GGDEF domain-containing protein [Roseibium hamelinense]MTI46142.1 GGDEF domain-containing protein [Roseibium hamelinense]TWI92665.1 diguanylate cyclase (GGDEF)-like protein [Roseibium hamelinense]